MQVTVEPLKVKHPQIFEIAGCQ